MTTTRPPTRQRGFALLWALFLVILVGSLGSVVLTRDVTVRRDGTRDLEALRALVAAEAGIERARHALTRGEGDWSGGELTVGACRVTVRVTRRDSRWDVSSEARPGGARIEASFVEGAGEDLPPIRWRRTR